MAAPATIAIGAGIGADSAWYSDPVKFAYSGGFTCDDWQADFLRCDRPRRMLNNARQSGKSSIVAWGILHRAVYRPNTLHLILSPGERQSNELMRKVSEAIKHAPSCPPLVRDGVLEKEFANGSRILALPGSEGTVRGYSKVDTLVIDEASRVPESLYVAVRPMLAVSSGDLWTLSTPFGTRGWWYAEWKQIQQDKRDGMPSVWKYFEVPAPMCPRITREFLREERERIGQWYFGQEFFCKFYDADTNAFSAADIEKAFAEQVIPWGALEDGRPVANDDIEEWLIG